MDEPGDGFFGHDDSIRDSLAYKYAERLYCALAEKRCIFISPSLRSWAAQMQRLLSAPGMDVGSFEDVFSWYLVNIRQEYVPKAYSAKTFCEKFVQIQDAKISIERRREQELKSDPAELLISKIRSTG